MPHYQRLNLSLKRVGESIKKLKQNFRLEDLTSALFQKVIHDHQMCRHDEKHIRIIISGVK